MTLIPTASACRSVVRVHRYRDKSIQIKGNPALAIWVQWLTKYLKLKKKK